MSIPLARGFLVNDPEHSAFGWSFLRGITPARLAVLAIACATISTGMAGYATWSGEPSRALAAFMSQWGRNFVAAVPVFILVVKAELWTAGWSRGRRVAVMVSAVAMGAALFAATRWAHRYATVNIRYFDTYWMVAVAHFFSALVIGGTLTAILCVTSEARRAAARAHSARLARFDIERQITEARLQLLRAQIEPHFLFNSLASVKRLYEKQSVEGGELLRNLITYLEAVRSRPGETCLRDEIALARSYLAIVGVRMGSRLAVDIDVATDVEAARVPPFMLGTLVENAIKHGIAPRASGGRVQIRARRRDNGLEIRVSDDGVGIHPGSGAGLGLANTRARLATLFGDSGRLHLAARPEGGAIATITLPLLRHDAPALAP